MIEILIISMKASKNPKYLMLDCLPFPHPRWTWVLFFSCGWLGLSPLGQAATALYLGSEYQKTGGTIRIGDPASDPVYAAWLATAGFTLADVSSTLGAAPKAVWGKMTVAAASTGSYGYTIGNTTVTASISGWKDSNSTPAISTGALLSTSGLDGTTLQALAPRPGFAKGANSGYYLGTTGGSSSDGIRNGVNFDLSAFSGGGVYSFGVFGGDLETGAPGSPSGFLLLTFTDNTTETIIYAPDATLFPNAVWDVNNNNTSQTYGNETTRFIGLVSDSKLIKSALFVVGDDDKNDNGDFEQLSFIAGGVTFLDSTGKPYQPTAIPEPGMMGLFGIAVLLGLRRRRS
jgi:MYXO-CTERM domain-containing protein